MTTLNVGDRVHLKWDHSVMGRVSQLYCFKQLRVNCDLEPTRISVIVPGDDEWNTNTAIEWWERIPEPLKENVPIDVLFDELNKACGELGAPWRSRMKFVAEHLVLMLRERGYGKNDD